jgi:integrase
MPEYTVQKFLKGYAIVYRDEGGKRHRRRLDATDRQSATSEARALWEQADESPITVGRIVNAYLDSKQETMASIERRRDAWKAMRSFWENVDPTRIDADMCKAYRKTRRVGDATVRLELGMLSTALGAAVGNQIVAKPRMWLPPAPERKERHLTPQQFNRLLGGVVAPHATMARPSALLDLQWSQVDFIRNTIDLNPAERRQTAKRRPVVTMNDTLRAAMVAAFRARDGVFVISRGGKQVGSIKKAFQAAGERSGVHATPYTLRHTGAVWAAERGMPMSEIAQFMGHDDDRTTSKHYARYSPDYLKGVANALEDAFNSGSEVQTQPSTPVQRIA